MSKLSAALSWARRGFRVFPLQENTKDQPLFPDFSSIATTDEATILHWWRDDLTGIERDRNIGVDTSTLLIVDLDNKDGKNGQEEYERLGGCFDTLTVRTPSGGYHLYYDPAGTAFANSQGDNGGLAPGVDTRGWHGYVLAPGSTINGAAYEVLFDAPLAPVPEVIRPRLRVPGERKAAAAPLIELDTPAAVATARDFLAHRLPAFQGMGGDAHTFQTACELRDRGVSAATALDLLLEEWNNRCEPPWEVLELRAKVENAYAYAQRGEGEKSPEAHFGSVVLIEPQTAPATPLDEVSEEPFGNALPESAIQRRPWLVEGMLLKRSVSALIAPGSAGKSLGAITLAVKLASGDDTIWGRANRAAARPARSLIYDAEDDLDEMSARARAVCRALNYDPDEILPHIRLMSGRGKGMGERLKVAIGDPPVVQEHVIDSLVSFAVRQGVEFMAFIPLGKLHDANENDNMAMGYIMDCLGLVAERSGAAVLIGHHTAKPSGVMSASHAGNANAGAGAKRIVDSVRAAFTMETMNESDALKYGVRAADRARYVRVDDAKHNYTLQGSAPVWLKKETVKLLNGDPVGALVETNMAAQINSVRDRMAQILKDHMTEAAIGAVSIKDFGTVLKATDELFAAMSATAIRSEIESAFISDYDSPCGRVKIVMALGTKSLAFE